MFLEFDVPMIQLHMWKEKVVVTCRLYRGVEIKKDVFVKEI